MMEKSKAREFLSGDLNTYSDPAVSYPANHFAFIKAKERFAANNVESLVEVGIGHGNAIPVFTAEGYEMSGFDNNPELVSVAQQMAMNYGQSQEQVIVADIEQAQSYKDLAGVGQFDALVAMGVMPHVSNEDQALLNMAKLVKPGGEVLIEFRNSLFSLFTFNRFTHEFILDELLPDVSPKSRELMDQAMRERFDVTKPGPATSKFHNPFEVEQKFKELGFVGIEVIPFHYHSTMPSLESQDPQAFRDDSIALESETSGWRGLFLCSAYVVHAFTQ
jgi:2-polyprenyl-3-methyl-5-hydroxy-6-metoxy-1,4-benzoquinol methylase